MNAVTVRPLLEEARRDAAAAAARSGVDVAEVDDLDGLHAVSSVFDRIWGRDDATSLVPFELLRAMSHGGNYVVAARSGDEVVGAAFGFRADHLGEDVLHSHILGVLDTTRSRGVGFAIKQDQRRWCLERGLTTMTWTFDPLVRRNAYFNLSRLGAEVAAYLPHFYGHMDDALNGGDSDRLLIRWDLTSPRAVAAARREPIAPTTDDVSAAAAALVDRGGLPELQAVDAPLVRCHIPEDIVALRRTNGGVSGRWREALREALSPRLSDGYRVDGVSRDGWYLLRSVAVDPAR